MTPPTVDFLMASMRGPGRSAAGPMRRVVVRLPTDDIARVDAMRRRLPQKTSRAALIRAGVLFTLDAAEEQTAPAGEAAP